MEIEAFRIPYHNGLTHVNEVMKVFATDKKTAEHIVEHSFTNKNSYIIKDEQRKEAIR